MKPIARKPQSAVKLVQGARGGGFSIEVILSERSEAKDPHVRTNGNATEVLRFAQEDLGANRNPASKKGARIVNREGSHL
jgi:hypothetical protein